MAWTGLGVAEATIDGLEPQAPAGGALDTVRMAGPLEPHGVLDGAGTHLVLGGEAGLGLSIAGDEVGGDGCVALLPQTRLGGATGTAWKPVTRGC